MKTSLCILCSLVLRAGVASAQNTPEHPEQSQYAARVKPALEQLEHYPAPRYLPGNKLARLFNWMDPYFMGGAGQPGISNDAAVRNGVLVQRELILNWNYGIVIAGAGVAFNNSGGRDTSCPLTIHLANEYPEVPLHIITNWMACSPREIGYPSASSMIRSDDLPASLYLNFDFYGRAQKEITFNFPDSLIHIDGETQKYYLNRILHFLHRPVDLINENGEEAPGPYQLDAIRQDKALIRMKDSMKIDSWVDFMAVRKLSIRNCYSASFLNEIPALKHTAFSFYTVEGGPIDRFSWPILKKCMTARNGIYYSTPDFYPRWPSNWKEWKGPWHGWSWIESGRKVEIRDGDYLFSPFVAAGWSENSSEDIRPGQWLGLLKCLAVVGAEFYYVGYFNLGAPFHDPAGYAWQAAMPAYAQAVTSRFEDVLRNGNVLRDTAGMPIISYPVSDRHMLITARKHTKKEKYVIAATYQPFSNDSGEIPEKKMVTVLIGKEALTFEVRRQGSVYVYEKLQDGKTLFYQLDSWHENAHPDRWSSNFCFEAETPDTETDLINLETSSKGTAGNFSDFTTFLHLRGKSTYDYSFCRKEDSGHPSFVWLRYKGNGSVTVSVSDQQSGKPAGSIKLPETLSWKWFKVSLPAEAQKKGVHVLTIGVKEGFLDLDKLTVTDEEGFHVPKD